MESVPEAGDPRVYFAAERTLLAWIRTGLAMMGFGFVVARFGLFLREIAAAQGAASQPHALSLSVGVSLVMLGVAVNVAAAFQQWHTIQRLNRGEPLRFQPVSLATIVALIMALIGLTTAGYLVFGLSR
ncbi:MAG TPA: DUF202 domain-containing protein [Planctomycetaceae bacterium]|nr:DUF202 domain-containing protein [Planctomycetaceae bacterium]